MLRRVLILSLCLTLVSCKELVEKYKRSSSGVSAVDKTLLFDFRNPVTPLQAAKSQPALPAGCTQVLSSAHGSFTYAAENEDAYLVRCGKTNRLIVFSAGKLQVSADTSYSAILKVTDLNHNDKDELLLVGESTHNGELTREASLVTLEKKSLQSAEDFGIAYHDPCAFFAAAGTAKHKDPIDGGRLPVIDALAVFYLPKPGQHMPSFTAERFRAPCANPSKWQRVGVR